MALTKTPIELSSTPGIVDNSNATAITIDSSEKVGIGESSPSSLLHLKKASDTADIILESSGGSGKEYLIGSRTDGSLNFYDVTASAERMRIDSSGNLLVGTTSAYGTTGTTINAAGLVYSSADGDRAGQFDRTTSDGELVRFSKAGTTVGSWRSRSGLVSSLVLDPRSTNSGCGIGTTDGLAIVSTDNTGALVDSDKDLGQSGVRWRDLYLSGGVYLGGTGAANKLEDYEEGAWTPVLTGTGYSFGTHTGRYVKVGNLVYITALLNVATVGSNNSIIAWSGAPFTTEAVNNLHQMGVVRESSTTGRLYQIQINAGSSSGSMNSMDGIAGGSNEIFTTGNYAVSVTYKI